MRKRCPTIRLDSDRTQPSARPSIQIANPPYTPDSFPTVRLRPQLLTKIAYVKINASIKRRKFPAQNAVELVSFCREHQYRGTHARAQFSQDVEALDIGQHGIQHDQVVVAAYPCLRAFGAGMHDRYHEPLSLQVPLHEVTQIRIVVYDQQARVLTHRFLLPSNLQHVYARTLEAGSAVYYFRNC